MGMRILLLLTTLALASCQPVAGPTTPGQPPTTGCGAGDISLKCAAR